jgi:hypothetical protein
MAKPRTALTTGARLNGHVDHEIFKKIWLTEREADSYGGRPQALEREAVRCSVKVHQKHMPGHVFTHHAHTFAEMHLAAKPKEDKVETQAERRQRLGITNYILK